MYDLDGNKYIDREEMLQIMESFYKLVGISMIRFRKWFVRLGPLVTFSGKKYDSPKALVDEFFEIMDTNHDGKISLEEYKEGALKNPDIIRT